MSNALRRSKLEALKSGNLSSSDEEEPEYYNEDEQDNYQDELDELDDFVIDDDDVGYKASAHQKQSKQLKQKNNTNNPRNTTRNTHQTQSYSISRRRRNNKNNNNTNNKNKSQTQTKKQSTMNNFFQKSNTKPRPRNINKRNNKKNKKAPKNKQNDDDFLADIMANMDGDSDDNGNNIKPNDNTNDNTNDTNMNCDVDVDNDIDIDIDIDDDITDSFLTVPQTQIDLNNNTNNTIEDACSSENLTAPQTQAELNNNNNNNNNNNVMDNEPPKKRVKYNANVTVTAAVNTKKSDKMEMSDDDMDNNDDNMIMFNETKQPEIEPEMETFDNRNNYDNYPESKPGYTDFFWFDAYEDPIRKPGQIYLFGKTLNNKTNKWESISIYIKNIERTLYILPRLKNKNDDIEHGERIEPMQVYQELNNKRSILGIDKFAAMPVDKKYCFRERKNGIPSNAQYLKCCYSFDHPSFTGHGNTYLKIFGARNTALEIFMLEKQIMGPCWLRLPFKKTNRIVTWCKQELMNENIDNISVLSSNYPSPNFKVLSLSFQTVLNNKKEHEVACVSGFIDDAVCVDHNRNKKVNIVQSKKNYFTFVRKMDKNPFPYDLEKELKKKGYNLKDTSTFKTFSTERELLTFFTLRIQQVDPDVICGHKLYDFLLDVMLHRMDKLNINMWSKIGRLRKSRIPFMNGRLVRKYLGCGRLFCDTFISSQEFIHCKTYTLSHLCSELLNIDSHENLNSGQIKKEWFDGAKLTAIITHCCNDSNLIYELMNKLQILALTKELTNLCGNLWSRSLLSQRAERNEWLLLHEFHRNGYIIPEKLTKNEKIEKGIISAKKGNKKRGKAQYSGGLVLEPIRGLYDKYVLCLDFNSLYPSIIQEYNLCFTSTKHWKYEKNKNKATDDSKEEEMDSISLMRADISAETGILPKVISVLLTRRTEVKKLLKNAKMEAEKKRLDIQQLALKLVANSMYGCLGFAHSRFYCQPIAALITALGRESLMKASEIASSIDNLKVIYGDTDSIFIYTDCDNLIKARNFAKEIKKKVNKTYKKMYLELDYVFSKMLLLRKKKYAAIKVVSFETDSSGNVFNMVTKKEIKGLDLVRRDWSIISRDVGQKVLDIILSMNDEYTNLDDIIVGVQELLTGIRKEFDENKIALEKFKITKKLTKAVKDYPDPKKQAHVMVAIEMAKLGMNVNVGSFIEYIVCKQTRDGAATSGKNKSISLRSYHISEIEKSMKENDNNNNNKQLDIDREWYLEQQILPPVGRYCSPIEGTDIGHLAHALGLDSNKFNHLKRNNNNNNNNDWDNDDDDDDIDDKILRIINPLQKYNEICGPLKIKCFHCNNIYDFNGVFNFKTIDAKCGLMCPTNGCKGIVSQNKKEKEIDIKRIKNSLSLQIWQYIYKYYNRQYICIDIECNYKTKCLSLNTENICTKIGCSAKMKETYSSKKLFDQLRYFSFLFDRKKQEKLLKQQKETQKDNKLLNNTQLTKHQQIVFDDIYAWIKKNILQKSQYYFIDSKVIFKWLM